VNNNQLSQADLDLLRNYDTPTICNVIEVFGLRPQTEGYMDARIRCCFPEMPPMVGYASTATFRSASPPRAGDVYAALDAQIAGFPKLPQPVVTVFQDLDDPPAGATFGEVMTSIYKSAGAVGLITSGAARDLEQVRAIGFPCFSDGVICSHAYPQIVSLEVPVRVGGLMVYPGDLLHGDANGVTNIPHEIASAVAHACAEFIKSEEVVLNYVRGGNVTPAGVAERRREGAAIVQKLREQVRR
jgi:regulator of RNase E activity RraA